MYTSIISQLVSKCYLMNDIDIILHIGTYYVECRWKKGIFF